MTFWEVFAAALLAVVAGKLISLAIDALLWIRSMLADIALAVAAKRGACKRR